MSRRLRSLGTGHHEDSKPLLYGGLLPDAMDGVETSEVTVGDNSEESDVEDKDIYAEEIAVAAANGDHYTTREGMDLTVFGKSLTKAIPTMLILQRLLSAHSDDADILPSAPQGHKANSCFFVHVPEGTHWKSLLADGLGAWKASKGPTNMFVRWELDEAGGSQMVATQVEQAEYAAHLSTGHYYYFQRRAYTNASCPQYHRSIVTSADQRCQFACMQYYFRDAIEHDFAVTVRASDNKSSRKYTVSSAGRKRQLPLLEGESAGREKMSPQRGLFASRGAAAPTRTGVMKVEVLGVVPSETVVFRSAALPDLLEDVLAKCLKEINTPEAYVQEIKVAPSVEITLATRRQLNDLRRFCTNPTNYTILCKDSIPNIGESGYTASFIVYEHLLLRCKDGKHPVLLGPVFLHHSAMDWQTAVSYAGMLVRLESRLLGVLAYTPSPEPEVDQAFQQVFHSAKRHVPDSAILDMVTMRMEQLGIADETADVIRSGVTGVVEMSDPLIELDQRAYQLVDAWQSLHQNGIELGQFFLDTVVPVVRQNLELKEKCGSLSVDAFAAQQCARTKELMKKACAKKCTLPELVRRLQEIVWKQGKDLEGVVLGRAGAEYKLDGEYAGLAYDEKMFYDNVRTPLSQRRVIVNRIHEEELH